MPTTRWLLGLAACSVAPLLLGDARTGGLVLLGLDLAWLACWWWDRARAPRAGSVEVQREAPATWSAGRPLVARYRWRLRTGQSVVTAVETLPAPLDDGRDPARRLPLEAGRWVDETITRTPPRRGTGTGGALHLRAEGPWGLAARTHVLDLPWSLTVLPALDDRARALPTARRRREAGQRPERIAGEGRELDGLREWVPGDDTRIVDWKATARRGKPIVRRYRDERRQPVLLALDAGRLMATEHEGRSRFDAAVDAAAALAWAAHAHDDDVGLLVFEAESRLVRAPRRGRAGLRAVLAGLAGASAAPVEPDYPRAFSELARRQRRRALVVLFTDVVDADTSAALVAQARGLRPRHLPVVVTLRDPALDAVVAAPADSVGAAYDRAAAEALLEARAVALEGMRADGIVVVDVAPAAAAQGVVAAYERLKARGAL